MEARRMLKNGETYSIVFVHCSAATNSQLKSRACLMKECANVLGKR